MRTAALALGPAVRRGSAPVPGIFNANRKGLVLSSPARHYFFYGTGGDADDRAKRKTLAFSEGFSLIVVIRERFNPCCSESVHHLSDDWDAGPIAFQDWCFIHKGETAADLWRRALAPMGTDLLLKAADHLSCYGFLPKGEPEPI